MTIINVDINDSGVNNVVNLSVLVENFLSLRVSSGAFKISGMSYVLDEDWVHLVTVNSEHFTDVFGYLAKNLSNGAIELVVDEVLLDGNDVPYRFNDGLYKLLTRLFTVRVPPLTIDLANLDIQVIRVRSAE